MIPPRAVPLAEHDVDLMLRQLRAAHWGGTAGGISLGRRSVLHCRLRRYAGSRSLFELQESLVRSAERMIGKASAGRPITWTDFQVWAWYYGLQRPPLQLNKIEKLYSRPMEKRAVRDRVAAVNEALIPLIADPADGDPAAEPTVLVGRPPDPAVPSVNSFQVAVLRALGEVAHGGDHDPDRVRICDLVLRRVVEQQPDARTLREDQDGELSADERETVEEYLALTPMARTRLRDQMRTLVGFHQQDVAASDALQRPAVSGIRWSLPPSEVHDPRLQPQFGASGNLLHSLEDAIDRLAPYLGEDVDTEDLVRALYDRSADLPRYAALTAGAIERYSSHARPPVDITAYETALAVDQVLLQKGFPDVGSPAGKALAQIDVAKLYVLLGSADPRALAYGQRALWLAQPGIAGGDRESTTLSMRAMRHMASVLRKGRNTRAAVNVHRRMQMLLVGHVLRGITDERDQTRQQAIHFIHVSCTMPMRHRNLIVGNRGGQNRLNGNDAHEVDKQVGEGQRLLHELNATDDSFRRAATVTRFSLMRRIVELSALTVADRAATSPFPGRPGSMTSANNDDEALDMLASVRREAQADNALTQLLAVRCGMHLAIALRDRDLIASLTAEAESLRLRVPANAVIHRQLAELSRAAEQGGLLDTGQRTPQLILIQH